MTNYEHNLMVTAINEYSDIGYDIKDLDEATDCLTYDEIFHRGILLDYTKNS